MKCARQIAMLGIVALLPLQAMAADDPAPAAADTPAPAVAHGPAMGQSHENKGWQKMDPSGKGYITKEEWLAHSAQKFKEIDTNGDGKITRDEMHAYHEKMRAKWHDGKKHHHHDDAVDTGADAGSK